MRPAMTTPASKPAPIVQDLATIPRKDAPGLPNLIGLTREGLRAALIDAGVPEKQAAMRTGQVWQWLYQKGAHSFDEMTNISKDLRAQLAEHFSITRPEIVTKQISNDGTRKYLLRVGGGHEVEAVFIPEADRGTLCISSQIGCTLTCSFCHTGTQKLVRNLTPAEIVGQILVARDDLEEWGKPAGDKRALISLSRRRITLSTSGIVPEIFRAGEEIGCMLAISFHATTDEVRDTLVPINRKYKIAELLQACRDYPRLSNAERITFEYVMLKDVNDSDADARRLVKLIAGIPAKINLIPFNPWPGAPYERSDWERIEAFADIVNRAGYASPVRTPRGEDIMAACGQLKSATERGRKRASEIAAEAGI